MTDIMIIDGARTPMGGLLGDLADATANELGTTAISATWSDQASAPRPLMRFYGMRVTGRPKAVPCPSGHARCGYS